MSLQWKVVAYFLYFEMGLVVLLMLPFISSKQWSILFNLSLIKQFTVHATKYFHIVLAILAVLFVDSIRIINKEDGKDKNSKIKELRAQRNFHIVGAAILLWFVINRMINLIAANATTSDKQLTATSDNKKIE